MTSIYPSATWWERSRQVEWRGVWSAVLSAERNGRSETTMHLNGGPLSEILVRVLCPFACHGGISEKLHYRVKQHYRPEKNIEQLPYQTCFKNFCAISSKPPAVDWTIIVLSKNGTQPVNKKPGSSPFQDLLRDGCVGRTTNQNFACKEPAGCPRRMFYSWGLLGIPIGKKIITPSYLKMGIINSIDAISGQPKTYWAELLCKRSWPTKWNARIQ